MWFGAYLIEKITFMFDSILMIDYHGGSQYMFLLGKEVISYTLVLILLPHISFYPHMCCLCTFNRNSTQTRMSDQIKLGAEG